MKKLIETKMDHEVLSLISDISYSCVPSWYGVTMRNLKMEVIAPKIRTADKKLPLIVWFCGGAYRVVDRVVWLPELLYFARNGFTVASVEYRTSNEATFPDPLIDGKSAIRYLKAHAKDFCIDPNRICVMGESAGGTMASLIGATVGIKDFDKGDFLEEDSLVQAVVDYYGIVDLTNITCNVTEDTPAWTIHDFLGINYTEAEAKKASAIKYITDKTPPMLILHGVDDRMVPISQSEQLYKKLQEQGVISEFYALKGAGHGTDDFYQEGTQKLVIEFLNKVL
nr:alpha/beta hydrolase [uncultured Clostridium sp.]